jgi:hypothetical protein
MKQFFRLEGIRTVGVASACLVALTASGCQWLDMGDQAVSERIKMHRGSIWYVDPKERERGNQDDTDRKDCEAYDPQQEAQLDPNQPPPKNAYEARLRYLDGKEIFLTSEMLYLGTHDPIELRLVNESMNCSPNRNSKDKNLAWLCNSVETEEEVALNAKADSADDPSLEESTPEVSAMRSDQPLPPLLDACVAKIRSPINKAVNFIGAIDNRYCIAIRVVEEKAKSHRNDAWPTRIERDSLRVTLRCEKHFGGSGPGALIGGPRPNFRSPIERMTAPAAQSQ